MDILLIIVLSVALLWILVRAFGKGSKGAPKGDFVLTRAARDSDNEAAYLSNTVLERTQPWIEQRWNRALAAKESGEPSDEFPGWYFDEATKAQLDQLQRMGIKMRDKALMKGQASDLIGLGDEPTPAQKAQLKYFKVPLRGLTQTQARAEITSLMADESNRESWQQRPATSMQRECIRFYGAKVPKGLSFHEAEPLIQELEEQDPEKADDWSNLESILDDFTDADFREMVEIKKPSKKAIQEAIDALVAEGRTLASLDSDDVASKILEAHPELERPWDY